MSASELWRQATASAPAILRVLGWQSLYVLVVFVIVALLCRCLRRRPALCHGLWGLVLLRLFLPPSLTHPLSVGALVAHLQSDAAMTESALGIASGGFWVAALPPAAAMTSPGRITDLAASWLVVVWLAGTLIALVRFARRRGRYRRIIRAARPVTDPAVLKLADTWRENLGVQRPVRLMSSPAKLGPFTMGWRRPVVFLPRAILDDVEMIVPIMAHEMAHVSRCDDLALKLQHLAQAVYFFHPAVRYAAAAFDGERERLCDALVLSHGSVATKDYAVALIRQLRLDRRVPAALAMSTTQRRLKMRVRTILAEDSHHPGPSWSAWFAVAVLGLILLPLAGWADSARQPTTAEAAHSGSDDAVSAEDARSLVVHYASVLGEAATVTSLGDWAGEASDDRGAELARLISSGQLDTMLRGDTILPPEGGSFSASTGSQELEVTYDVRIEPMADQVGAWVEVRRGGEMVSAPRITLLYDTLGSVLTGLPGQRLFQLLLKIDRPGAEE